MDEDEVTRRAALARFALITTAGWMGISAPRAAALTTRHTATLRAFAETYGVADPVRALHRQSGRMRHWAAGVLDALEHAPADGRFSHMTAPRRAAAVHSWWSTPEYGDQAVFVPRASDTTAPEGLAAANAAAVARIRARQRAVGTRRDPRTHLPAFVPRAGHLARAGRGPLASEVQRLRHLRGSAEDLATILRRAR